MCISRLGSLDEVQTTSICKIDCHRHRNFGLSNDAFLNQFDQVWMKVVWFECEVTQCKPNFTSIVLKLIQMAFDRKTNNIIASKISKLPKINTYVAWVCQMRKIIEIRTKLKLAASNSLVPVGKTEALRVFIARSPFSIFYFLRFYY